MGGAGPDRPPADAARVAVADALAPVRRSDRHGDQLETGMHAMLGVAHRLRQRQLEQTGLDRFDLRHAPGLSGSGAVPRIGCAGI